VKATWDTWHAQVGDKELWNEEGRGEKEEQDCCCTKYGKLEDMGLS
jgi:hypothetical protein